MCSLYVKVMGIKYMTFNVDPGAQCQGQQMVFNFGLMIKSEDLL